MRQDLFLAIGVVTALNAAPVQAQQAEQNPRAQQQSAAATPTTFIATRVIAEGTIEQIDQQERTLSLKLSDGQEIALKVRPEAKEFQKLKTGDPVAVDYLEAMTVALAPAPAGAALPAERAEAFRITVPGAEPASAIVNMREVAAVIDSVDPTERTVTLRVPGGEMVKLNLSPDVPIESLRPGNQVVARYTQALAMDVRKTG